ncbi:hypothetical protein DSL64_04355 [Dyadobacter luteus]|jgi:hypothetical protein|uniref:Uncharacterized protein n=1 Tax=Dyadobacter luteus TaxID=2259619 RepID=A0A3D8YGA6_9BACT|nr:hypothetical protein [Dyadobacter luteus]REA63673.1 hypothetical protein DSL64_04355 [Dyadobacter luteus]
MAIQFFSNDIIYQTPLPEAKPAAATAPATIHGDIANSSSVSGVELRILPPYIKDNNTAKVPLFPGRANLYCLVVVVGDVGNQLVGGIDLQGFPRIGDHEYLPINKTIYYWQKTSEADKSPNQIHAFCSIIKSRKKLREAASIMAEVKGDEDYKSLVTQIASLASKATPVTVALDLVSSIAGLVGKYLKNVEDKPIGTIVNSYTVIRGDFDTIGVNKHRYTTPKVDFEMELTIRDKTRQPSEANADDAAESDEVEVLISPIE